MLFEIMNTCKNFFPVSSHSGKFTIENGYIDLPFLMEGQYFKVEGSVFNDGVFQYNIDNLIDETFDGNIVALAIPNAFLDLVGEIEEWQAKYGNPSPYMSESFGGYSYTKANQSSSGASTWKDAFKSRLNQWRKL